MSYTHDHQATRRLLALSLSSLVLSASSRASAQEMPDVGALAGFIRWGGVALSLLVVFAAVVALRVVSGLAESLGERFTSQRLLIQKIESITRFAVYVVTAALCVGLSVRLDATALTVIGGALAFAVGFAMRDLVAAFIAGITIMFDRPFQVGDRVEYGGQYGDIIKIGLRSVQMNTLDHNIVTIPNNKVLTDVTSSSNYGELEMQVAMTFYVGIDQDVHRAREIVREACLTSGYVFLGSEVPVLTKQVIVDRYLAFEIKARPYVLDTKYEKTFETDVHLRVSEGFRKAGIQPPAILHRYTSALGAYDTDRRGA